MSPAIPVIDGLIAEPRETGIKGWSVSFLCFVFFRELRPPPARRLSTAVLRTSKIIVFKPAAGKACLCGVDRTAISQVSNVYQRVWYPT